MAVFPARPGWLHSPVRLPFLTLVLLSSLLVHCIDDEARDFDDYLLEMESRGLYDPLEDPYAEDSDFPPAIEASLCSLPGNGAARTVSFENATTVDLDIFWVDTQCTLRPYGMVAPGQRHDQPTYEGHAWRFHIAGSTRPVFEVLLDASTPNPVVIEGQQ
ncbi:hypothetical protein FRC96_02315 [Lujinxingia vulgaris]|uniref:von Hippel-Lindau disease tumour suppressor beta domain-containing protein n=1 Tax=Lujinxingia vulgaris TaxID=2600176 RepID=A0A5C6XSQ0_9DELT|nr:hypothetical protein [Lujinxingia vulgaris]TXD42877.1 hypothetical protein FRC96_02315 [Lujinxingia vulgaris]